MAPSPSAYERVLEHVGSEIVSGARPPGSRTTVETLVTETGASRSVVREAVRVLESLGALSAGRRVGITVLDRSEWNVLDARMVRWRLSSKDRERQLAELHDLRLAIEPEAAALAAVRRDDRESAELSALADRLVETVGSAPSFLDADQRFHGLLLQASRNRLFLRLRSIIDEALRDRADAVRRHGSARRRDAVLHRDVADAIAAGDGERAAAATREIVVRTIRDGG